VDKHVSACTSWVKGGEGGGLEEGEKSGVGRNSRNRWRFAAIEITEKHCHRQHGLAEFFGGKRGEKKSVRKEDLIQ